MNTREQLDFAAAIDRMACDTQAQLDWLERKVEWAVLMVDTGMLSLDEARAALKTGNARAIERGRACV